MSTLENPMNNEKKILTIEDVETFASEGRLTGNPTKRCVDGRHESYPTMPECSIPGADAGNILTAWGALLAMDIEPTEEVAKKINEAVIEEAGGIENVHFHTDEHNQGVVAGGCGHMANALKDPEAYGINERIASFIMLQLAELKGAGAQEEVLKGGHKEGAVVIVRGEHGMAPNNSDGTQAFVYQENMATTSRTKLASLLASKLELDPDTLATQMDKVATLELNETLKRLASGLPTFVVEEGSHGKTVTQIH